jgi:catechol 2,3-dioxygenase-like lactoylglutathione lyase family enzyme
VSIKSVDHVGFTVADMDRSVEWYTRLLGDGPTLRKTWDVDYIGEMVGYSGCRMECAYFGLPGGGTLELVRYLDPPSVEVDMETYAIGNGHLCVVVDDIHAEFDRLSAFASLRSTAPIRIPWGPYEGGWGAYLRDPDEITIQLMQHPPGGPKLDERR